MTIKVTKTLEVSPAKLRKILIEHFAAKRGIPLDKVKIDFKASTRSDDNGFDDRGSGTPVFTGATIIVEETEEFEL